MYPHERSLVEKFQDRPFSIIGINSDRDRAALKKTLQEERLSWRSFWDGGSTNGPIASSWNIVGWPTLYILDHKGVIRYINLRDETKLDQALEDLVTEAEKARKAQP
jgi:hypothetical protein